MTTAQIDPVRSARSGLHLWVALLLALLLLVSWFMGYGPGGDKCAPAADTSLGGPAATQSAAPSVAPAVALAPAPLPMPAAAPASAPAAPASAETMAAISTVAAASGGAPANATSPPVAATVQNAPATATLAATPVVPAATPTPPPEPLPAPAASVSAVPVAKVYFGVEKANFPKSSARTLARVVKYLKANPRTTASVSGFHDPSGTLANNQNLALRRAQAVASNLQKMGIAKTRIVLQKPEQTIGSGNSTEARRVEVSVANP